MKFERKADSLRVIDLALCALFAALAAVGAFIKIPVPVVPITLQTLFTMLAGLLLGARRGAVSVGLYIFIGLVGVPVFTKGGGIGYVLEPTFGYIIGFAIGAYVGGAIAHKRRDPSFIRLMAANLVNLGILYALGMVYFYTVNHLYIGNPVGIWTVFYYCFLVTIPGDIVCAIVAAALAKRLIPVISGNGWITYGQR